MLASIGEIGSDEKWESPLFCDICPDIRYVLGELSLPVLLLCQNKEPVDTRDDA